MRYPAYPAFGLTLVVNHACNLRCTYCYTGAKFHAPMPVAVGEQAIQRALVSLRTGGVLHLGFFGGEPLIEAPRIHEWMRTARRLANDQGKEVRFNLTTNGTIADADATAVLLEPDIDIAISCDGIANSHDKHRRTVGNEGSFAQVDTMLGFLIAARRIFSVVMVVRPDTVDDLAPGLVHLRELGVTRFVLSLDIWATWTPDDIVRLTRAVDASADQWRAWLPDASIDWFDTRIAALAGLSTTGADTRCAFGEGEITVAPSGRLYPCERLVGEDRPGHPLQLPGVVFDGDDFLDIRSPGTPAQGACSRATCHCTNYVRTGSTAQEDSLLLALDKAVHQSLERLIATTTVTPST